MQASSLGLGEQWEKIKVAYAAANRALGDIVKVQPAPWHLRIQLAFCARAQHRTAVAAALKGYLDMFCRHEEALCMQLRLCMWVGAQLQATCAERLDVWMSSCAVAAQHAGVDDFTVI